jgi:hypothetical protein
MAAGRRCAAVRVIADRVLLHPKVPRRYTAGAKLCWESRRFAVRVPAHTGGAVSPRPRPAAGVVDVAYLMFAGYVHRFGPLDTSPR